MSAPLAGAMRRECGRRCLVEQRGPHDVDRRALVVRHGEEVDGAAHSDAVGADRQTPRAERQIGAPRLAAEDERPDVLLRAAGRAVLSSRHQMITVLRVLGMDAGVGEGVGSELHVAHERADQRSRVTQVSEAEEDAGQRIAPVERRPRPWTPWPARAACSTMWRRSGPRTRRTTKPTYDATASCQNCGGCALGRGDRQADPGDGLVPEPRQVVAARDVERHLTEAAGVEVDRPVLAGRPVDEDLELEQARPEHRPHGIDRRRA